MMFKKKKKKKKKIFPTCSGTLGGDTAPQHDVDGTLISQQLQQGRDMCRVGEGNAVHDGRSVGGRLPCKSRENITVHHATRKRLHRKNKNKTPIPLTSQYI